MGVMEKNGAGGLFGKIDRLTTLDPTRVGLEPGGLLKGQAPELDVVCGLVQCARHLDQGLQPGCDDRSTVNVFA